LEHLGQTSMTFDKSSGASNWMMPGFIVRPADWTWR
jgi:hypothetical protein